MITNSQLSTNDPKKIKERKTKQKLNKQLEQEENQRNRHQMVGFQWEGAQEEQGGNFTGKEKHNWYELNRWGEVRNGIGNRELKELICTTRGHELREGVLEGFGEQRGGGIKVENWENCNSIINKI